MGSEFRLVIIDGCSKLAKAVSEPLVEYLRKVPQPHNGLPHHRRLACQNTRLYKAIAKIDKKAVIDCSGTKRWELPRRAFSRWRRSTASRSRRRPPGTRLAFG